MKDSLLFKKAGVESVEIYRELGSRTFLESFGEVNSESDMQEYLSKSFDNSVLKKQLNNSDIDVYFVYHEDRLVGYLKLNFNKEQNEPYEDTWMELERIYLLSDVQGKGFGQKMLEFAEKIALDQGKTTVWLGVWEHNNGARCLYERMGFEAYAKHDFLLGKDLQVDILMKKSLC